MVVSSRTSRGGSGGALAWFARVIVHPEVADALRDGRGVVALESTLIAHGLPAPENVRVAREAEAAVRAAGAVPATIAVVAGEVRVGLDDAALEAIALGEGVMKAGVRDLAPAVARGADAATTVASTAHLAARAGIAAFATGGLGGGHPRARGEGGGATWPPAPASRRSRPAASAGCTAERARRGTSRPTSRRCRRPASSSSAPA